MRQRGAGNVEHAVEVDRHDLAPAIISDIDGFTDTADAGIVDHDVDAPKVGSYLFDGAVDRFRVAHIARVTAQASIVATGRFLFDELVDSTLVEVDGRARAALLQEPAYGCRADARCSSGDDDVLAFDPVAHLRPPAGGAGTAPHP